MSEHILENNFIYNMFIYWYHFNLFRNLSRSNDLINALHEFLIMPLKRMLCGNFHILNLFAFKWLYFINCRTITSPYYYGFVVKPIDKWGWVALEKHSAFYSTKVEYLHDNFHFVVLIFRSILFCLLTILFLLSLLHINLPR